MESMTQLSVTSKGQLVQQPGGQDRGHLERYDREFLDLFRREEVDFDILFVPNDSKPNKGVLWVTLYGHPEIANELGETLQDLDIYLQDPLYAARDVVYCNPHRFGREPNLRTSDILQKTTRKLDIKKQEISPSQLLAEFVSEDHLPETKESKYVRTQLTRYTSVTAPSSVVSILFLLLHSYQRRGLTFMLQREQGWALSHNETDVWSMDVNVCGQRV